ncbi:hypothetical protein GCM10028793_19060 [Nocardiopsis oceani]
MRLPTGIVYAGGAKANVLFFDRKPAMESGEAAAEKLWVYGFRAGQRFPKLAGRVGGGRIGG